jgi:anti-sigma B factor antagonist
VIAGVLRPLRKTGGHQSDHLSRLRVVVKGDFMTVHRRVQTTEVGDTTVVSFLDPKILDAASIQELGDDLFGLIDFEGRTNLVLDFSNVEFLSSAALNKLIILDKKVKARSGQLKLCCLMPEIREVFVITRLNQLFQIEASREAALAGI